MDELTWAKNLENIETLGEINILEIVKGRGTGKGELKESLGILE